MIKNINMPNGCRYMSDYPNLLLYLNLRLKQIVRILVNIGPFRSLFLLSIVAILF